jgi:hypothetical protein
MDPTTFEFLTPTDAQKDRMGTCRKAFADLAAVLERNIHDGADKAHAFRLLRASAMWVNVAITRHTDGSPRDAQEG